MSNENDLTLRVLEDFLQQGGDPGRDAIVISKENLDKADQIDIPYIEMEQPTPRRIPIKQPLFHGKYLAAWPFFFPWLTWLLTCNPLNSPWCLSRTHFMECHMRFFTIVDLLFSRRWPWSPPPKKWTPGTSMVQFMAGWWQLNYFLCSAPSLATHLDVPGSY